jgi:hypothetical protein
MKGSENTTEAQKLALNYWQQFVDYASKDVDFMKHFSLRSPQPRQFFDVSVGSSKYHLFLSIHTQKNTIEAGIYISDDKEIFEKFKSHKDEIENTLGCGLKWSEASKACRIVASQSVNVRNTSKWSDYSQWMMEKSLQFKSVVKTFDK